MKSLISPKKYSRLQPQTSGKEVFLKHLLKKRRGYKSVKTVIKKFKLIWGVVIPLLLLGTGIFIGYKYLSEKGYFKINLVEVYGTGDYVNSNDLNRLVNENAIGNNILVYDTNKLQKILKNNFLGAKSIVVQKILPDKIRIEVQERTPLAVVISVSDNKAYLIDGEGYVLGEVGSQAIDLPKVRYEGNVSVGNVLVKDIAPITLEILSLAEKDDLKVSSISFYPTYIKLFDMSGAEVLVPNAQDRVKSMDTAAYLLKKLALEGKKVRKIDLRYDKVIVLYD